jgi:hypothetical protein
VASKQHKPGARKSGPTADQRRAWAEMSALSAAWNNLTEEQRQAWNAEVLTSRGGGCEARSRRRSGRRLFVKVNSRRFALGQNLLSKKAGTFLNVVHDESTAACRGAIVAVGVILIAAAALLAADSGYNFHRHIVLRREPSDLALQLFFRGIGAREVNPVIRTCGTLRLPLQPAGPRVALCICCTG